MTRVDTALILSLVIGLSGSVLADNLIVSWGDGTLENDDFRLNQDAATITIVHGNGNNYAFYASDLPGGSGTGVINAIVVDPNAVGDFTITIDDPNCNPIVPGAARIDEADLISADPNSHSTLLGLHVAGNFGTASKPSRSIASMATSMSRAICTIWRSKHGFNNRRTI